MHFNHLAFVLLTCIITTAFAQAPTNQAASPPVSGSDTSSDVTTAPQGDAVAETPSTTPNAQASIPANLNPASLVQVLACPSTSSEKVCNCSLTTSWSCPAGYFCQSPSSRVQCQKGFYCPANTFQPIYCCSGYYCPNTTSIIACPEGYYCQQGSIKAKKCWLGSCQPFSDRVSKFYVMLLFILLILGVLIVFALKRRHTKGKQQKYRSLLEDVQQGKRIAAGKTKLDVTSQKFDIKFENLGLVLPNGVRVMHNVTGELRAGRTCAIMGPSGAGKTTFISLLTEKAKKTSGKVFINGKEGSLSKYRKLIGFVPQEDVMIRELTVRDILTHSAMVRLPSSWSGGRKKEKVLKTIDYLGLAHVMDSNIGDEETRGISGGQRKRVNIGMELVAEPSILFLDEPTSGLDSSTSLEVCSLLSNIAQEQKLTVAAIIHSPSPSAFAQFDDLLLLGKGGRVIFHGELVKAPLYFENIGFPLPEGMNPADYFMDVASGKAIRSPGFGDEEYKVTELFDIWEEYVRLNSTGASNKETRVNMGSSDLTLSSQSSGFITFWINIWLWIVDVLKELLDTIISISRFFVCVKDPIRETPSSFYIFWRCLIRSFFQYFRSPSAFIGELVLHLGCGLFIAIAAQRSYYLGPLPDDLCNTVPLALQARCRAPQSDNLRQIGQFVSWGIGFAGIAVGSLTFGNEKVVYWREQSSGIPAFPYYLAKVIADLPRVILAAICFLLAFIIGYNYNQEIYTLYLIVLSLYFWGFSSGYLVSAAVSKQLAALVGVVYSLIWAIAFSGVEPSVKKTRDEKNPLRFILDISAPRWAISGFYLQETSHKEYQNIKVGLVSYGYDQDSFGQDILNIFLISIGWQVVAFLLLKLLHREKQK